MPKPWTVKHLLQFLNGYEIYIEVNENEDLKARHLQVILMTKGGKYGCKIDHIIKYVDFCE